MLSSSELIKVIAEKLKFYKAKKIVIDPIMLAWSGSNLIKTEAISTMIDCLFPIADLITPNIPEAEILSDMKINTKKDMEKSAEKIGNLYNVAVLLKGGAQYKWCEWSFI